MYIQYDSSVAVFSTKVRKVVNNLLLETLYRECILKPHLIFGPPISFSYFCFKVSKVARLRRLSSP